MSESTNKLVVWMQSSLDGRADGPDGAFDWPVVGEHMHAHFVETLADAGQFLYGRNVFQMMASYWPIADELPDSTPMQVAYAKIWRPMPKLVFSRTLHGAEWNAEVIPAVSRQVLDSVRAVNGDSYLFGGAETVAEFARQDLIDEYRIFVHPIVLGGGSPLIPALPHRQEMTLVGTRTFDERVVELRYARVR